MALFVTSTRVRLLEVEPDLAAFLSHEERDVAHRLTAPLIELPPGPMSLEELGTETDAFAAIIIDGIMLNRLGTGDQRALRLLGPGDVLTLSGRGQISWLQSDWEAAATTTPAATVVLVMLDDHFLAAASQLPRLTSGLQTRVAEQIERLAAQMIVCQLPRVGDRVLSLLWLLAESWGRVTASGTVVPIVLTHDTIGELIGAKRSTVTLAVTELYERGALIRNDSGWLLLERPRPGGADRQLAAPNLIAAGPSGWELADPPPPELVVDHQQTIDAVLALGEQHLKSAELFRERLERAALSRERSRELRERSGAARLDRQHHRDDRERGRD